jgi:hypothetical protein
MVKLGPMAQATLVKLKCASKSSMRDVEYRSLKVGFEHRKPYFFLNQRFTHENLNSLSASPAELANKSPFPGSIKLPEQKGSL